MIVRLLPVLLVLCASPLEAQSTCSPTNTSAAAIATSAAPTVAMPTSASANATLWVLTRNRTDATNPTTVTGSVNGAFTQAGCGGTQAGCFYYKVAASAGTDTVTVDYSGASKSSQLIAGWCTHSSGSAHTFDEAATVANFTAQTTETSNTIANVGNGFMLIGVLSNNPVTFTASGSETILSGDAAGQRMDASYKAFASGGTTYSGQFTSASVDSSVLAMAFSDPGGGGASAAKNCTLLGVCE